MTDEDRFSGVDEALAARESDGEAETDKDPEPDEDPAQEAESDESGGPAFGYDDAAQVSVYPRPESWQSFQTALTIVEGQLRGEHDLHDVETRELHDAALRVVAESRDDLVDEVVALREEDEEIEEDSG